ncbi:hypothetical protein Ahy_A06g029533 isoform A [Arachis hypogaea]|uniref:non-specific serine/threonine protein kinase n=1 Tax=Arachis hypogaea TaxID=3818 RepID=A0A445CTL3_ARAHY|nr:hypothetical protein Ahy_A06g029533 isoform A [Arachis hypogaea]
MLPQICHRNIVKLHGFCLHYRCMFLVFDYKERGSLFYALNMDDEEAKEHILHLSHNMISCFTSLTSFYLSNNQLGENIPLEIGIIDSLCDVNLSNNKLEGLIPSPMLNCISFAEVDLSNNLLSGNIFSKISYVKKLDMSHNLFSGSVSFFYNNLTWNLSIELVSIPHINLSSNFFECPQGCKDFYAKSMIGNTPRSVNSFVQDQNTKKIKAPRYNCFPISCSFLLVIFVGIFCFIRRTKKVKNRDLFSIWNYDGIIAFDDIIEATQDFDIICCIETSTYGYMYKAQLSNSKIFALKKLY